jgi:hypothetical protein
MQLSIRTVLVAASALACATASSPARNWGTRPLAMTISPIPRGGALLDSVQAAVLQSAAAAIDALRQMVVEQGRVVEDFGHQADTICNRALQEFTSVAPAVSEDYPAHGAAYDRSLEQLTASLDAPLQVLYLKQLAALRQSTLAQYRAATASDAGVANYEAMLQADAQFVAAAEALTRPGSDWEYASERSFLQAVMNNLAESVRAATTVKLNSAQQQQTAMQFLQSQQQMIQQLQMQLYGQNSPWNVGVAYRIPDTNFNIQGTYQQGRANVQLSCVPDEYAPFLGPSGFTNGVGPGNLGLSLNLSV